MDDWFTNISKTNFNCQRVLYDFYSFFVWLPYCQTADHEKLSVCSILSFKDNRRNSVFIPGCPLFCFDSQIKEFNIFHARMLCISKTHPCDNGAPSEDQTHDPWIKVRPIQFILFLKEGIIDIPDKDYLNLLIGHITQVLDIQVHQILQSMPAVLQICQNLPN